jgi:hypothetical protein
MRTLTFTVKDKPYTLRYDFNASCDIEEMAGVGIPALVSGERVGMNTVRLILWGGLKWKNAGLTKQAVGFIIRDLLDEKKVDLMELFNDAIKLLAESMPQGEPEAEDGSEGKNLIAEE